VIVDDSAEIESNLYFDGKVAGDAMEGVMLRGVGSDQRRIEWRASRITMPSNTLASRRSLVIAVGIVAVLGASGAALSQQQPDVPYVPTPWNVVDAMLEIARVGAADNLLDLGAGDGRIVIEAARKYGTRGTGIELDANLVSDCEEGSAAPWASQVRLLLRRKSFQLTTWGRRACLPCIFCRISTLSCARAYLRKCNPVRGWYRTTSTWAMETGRETRDIGPRQILRAADQQGVSLVCARAGGRQMDMALDGGGPARV
jgi:hypothetical protein